MCSASAGVYDFRRLEFQNNTYVGRGEGWRLGVKSASLQYGFGLCGRF